MRNHKKHCVFLKTPCLYFGSSLMPNSKYCLFSKTNVKIWKHFENNLEQIWKHFEFCLKIWKKSIFAKDSNADENSTNPRHFHHIPLACFCPGAGLCPLRISSFGHLTFGNKTCALQHLSKCTRNFVAGKSFADFVWDLFQEWKYSKTCTICENCRGKIVCRFFEKN